MSSSASDRASSGRPPELAVVRILIVDDDPQAGALIEMALADARFTQSLEVVGTAAEGLRRILAGEHDIYLVDYRLPDGTGLDLIAQAKASGATRPFILMTGFGSGALDEAALKGGVADYVEKHLVGTHLERSIRYALRDWQAQHALHQREEQLRQAQKMEALGRLAGGIAHDFNNLLTAIIGYTDILLERAGGEQSQRDVREIRKAADRAAALTRQLLAFGRKQFLQPDVIDLNETVRGLLEMVPRIIGEHVQTTTQLAASLRRVTADPSQMEQVLINLMLNARDAMPSGGTITIRTANIDLGGEDISALGLTLSPGSYVLLSVSDTGTGMDAETRAHAFEPFYTTKPKGKGTGLGLATVYGIVDQSGGAIAIRSAVGRGTTLTIYLPEATSPSDARETERSPMETRGTETVLLVEDDDAVRELARRALRQRGYTVLEARNADEAVQWMQRGAQPQLLLTDVVMPGMSGPQLAAQLTEQRPFLRVLYMSGYSGNVPQAPSGATQFPLLQKPFTPTLLAERVRLALDASPGSV